MSHNADVITKLIETINEFHELEEWNQTMSALYRTRGDHEKALAHSAASGAIAAMITILQDSCLEKD